MRFVFQALQQEQVPGKGGKTGYTKATVIYTYDGQPRKQTIMSFSNPGILKQVQELSPGDEIDVEVVKNAGGFNEWKSISVSGSGQSASTAPVPSTATTRVTGSNYETKEERAARQVLIVKQSCLAQAVASLKDATDTPHVDDILERAQVFTDWVFDLGDEVLSD